MNQNLKIGIIIVAALVLISFVITILITSQALDLSPNSQLTSKAALIKISGEITTEPSASLFAAPALSSSEIAKLIDDANKNKGIDAVLFEINSPGGTVVASEEIANAIKKVEKPTVSYIKEVGASGGYWVASATDWIVADKYSTTGSIGVIGSYLSFAGLLDRYNITYERLVGGKYKDVGSPYRDLTPEEMKLLQGKIDLIHNAFIEEVAQNRNLSYDYVANLATGMFYLGQEAYELGLVDELGNEETAKTYLKDVLGADEIKLVEYKKEPSLLEAFSQILSQASFFVGQGISFGFVEAGNKNPFKV